MLSARAKQMGGYALLAIFGLMAVDAFAEQGRWASALMFGVVVPLLTAWECNRISTGHLDPAEVAVDLAALVAFALLAASV